jgi:Na+-transporting NADH:ubiquinone oxidoreductase subunit NqrB
MSMANQPNDSMVLSYLALRKAVGAIGIALPFVLVAGHFFEVGFRIEASISAYYWTNMRDVFVGSLCAIAVFLASYHGPEKADDIAGDLACVSALGVALVPTTPVNATGYELGPFHLAFAAAFFLVLSYFCLVLFRKTDPTKPPTPAKLKRNKVYAACGYTMLGCIALVAVLKATPRGAAIAAYSPVFWLESIAILAFGLSWATKGEAILKD